MKREDKKLPFPKFRKKINSFLVGEEGKMSKSSLFKTGLILGGVGASIPSISAGTPYYTESLSLGTYSPESGSVTAIHSSHASHSHHSSGGWC